MEVFRITKARFADRLYAPGIEGRWNRKGEEVIYTSSSRSLACLENLAHKHERGGVTTYKTMVIYIPDHWVAREVSLDELPNHWNEISLHEACQQIGSSWYSKAEMPLLKVPSAIIPEEFNYVLNARHADFKEAKIINTLAFRFDKRL